MRHLLDVNVLLAAIWANHPQHAKVFAWLSGKNMVVCPIAELGFLRISTNPKTFNAPMEKSRELLNRFMMDRHVRWIPDDLPALKSQSKKSDEVTDAYLARLAETHGLMLATLDKRISHKVVVLI